MERWVVAGTLDDLWEGEMRAVMLDGRQDPAVQRRGRLSAYDNSCPHLANPCSHGDLEGHMLTCAAHEWSFDVRTGGGINPSGACLQPYPVRLEGDRVFVRYERGSRMSAAKTSPIAGSAPCCMRRRSPTSWPPPSRPKTTTSSSTTKERICGWKCHASAGCPARRWRPHRPGHAPAG